MIGHERTLDSRFDNVVITFGQEDIGYHVAVEDKAELYLFRVATHRGVFRDNDCSRTPIAGLCTRRLRVDAYDNEHRK